jgi:Protein of unknown function (DUF1302)
MRKLSILLGIVIAVLFFKAAFAEMNINGSVLTDNRFQVEEENNTFVRNENRLTLKLDADISGAHVYSEVWLRAWGIPGVLQSSDLQEPGKEKINPWALDLREAYVDFHKIVIDNLELRVGKQIIAWGTADKLNPTNNINPDDLEDIMDFGRKLGTNAINMTYYIGEFSIAAVYVPIFTPAVLPSADWASALSPSFSALPGMAVGNFTDTIILPKNNAGQSSMAAVKIGGTIFNYDISASYFYGRDDLPLVNQVLITPTGLTTVDIDAQMIFPRMQVIGLDLAGAIGKVGIWAEGAVFISDEVEMLTDLSALGMGVQSSIALEAKPYFKYVVGGDYTFKNGIYINAQYLHGFIHERDNDNLEDYLMAGIEKKYFNDELKIMLGLGAEIKDFNELEDNYAIMIFPELSYYPVDNTEIILGAYLIDGKDPTNFGKVKKNDELYLKCKYSF